MKKKTNELIPQCRNHFFCHICNEEYIRTNTKEEQMKEHRARGDTIDNYDSHTDDVIEVCDPCFIQVMRNNL